MKPETILFDMDGTLWYAVDEILITWNQVIARHPGLRSPITREEQEQVMGMQMDEIARRLFPMVPEKEQLALMDECTAEENLYLAKVGGMLYPELEQMLDILSKRYQLCIVSNCQKGYIEAFFAAHHLQKYFTDYICFGDTGLRKGQSMLQIMERNHFTSAVYVGDTQGDCEESEYAGIPFVYAAYGIGKAEHYDYVISKPMELVNLF